MRKQSRTNTTKSVHPKITKSLHLPQTKEIITGGHIGPYPLIKKPNHPGYKRYKIIISDSWETDVSSK